MKIDPTIYEQQISELSEKWLNKYPSSSVNDIDEFTWKIVLNLIKFNNLVLEDIITVTPILNHGILVTIGEGYCDTLVHFYKICDKDFILVNSAKWHDLITYRYELKEDNLKEIFNKVYETHWIGKNKE